MNEFIALLQTASWKDPITVATVVVAVFTVVSVIVSAFMWNATRQQARISRQIFEAAHRPYIGVTEFTGIMSISGVVACGLTVSVSNSGTVPAKNLTARWTVTLEEEQIYAGRSDEGPSVLLPGESKYLRTNYQMGKDKYEKLQAGSILKISVNLEYQGVTEQPYSYTQFGEFDVKRQRGYVMTEARST
jgi:hypothetical protein